LLPLLLARLLPGLLLTGLIRTIRVVVRHYGSFFWCGVSAQRSGVLQLAGADFVGYCPLG
jgi:hypothetical protein